MKRFKAIILLHRSFLSGSILEYLIVLMALIATAVVLTNFVAFNIDSQLFVGGAGDATAGFLWLNFADPSLNPFLSKTTIVNYPYGETLGSSTFISYTLLWLPLRVLSFIFGPVAALNIMMFIGLVGGGLAAYWFVKRLTNSRLVSLFAAFAVAFVPYNLYKSSSHLAYIFTIDFVLIFAAFVAFWLKPTITRAILFGVAICIAYYTDGYYLLIASVMAGGLVLSGFASGIFLRFKLKDYVERLKGVGIAVLTVVILCLPILITQYVRGDEIQSTLSGSRSNISDEINAYRSNVIDFIFPSASNPFISSIDQTRTIDDYKNLRSNYTENITYMGFVVIALCAIGFLLLAFGLISKRKTSFKALSERHRKIYIILGVSTAILSVLFLAFMFSPSISVRGVTIQLPGQFMIDHGIAFWRVLARFFVPFHVVAVIFAAYTLWVLTHTVKLFSKHTTARFTLVGVLIVITMAEYATMVYRPSFDFSTSLPKGYYWLAANKDIKTIAELPVVDPLDSRTAEYVTAQIVHGKKIINLKEPSAERLTNVIGSVDNPETLDFIRARGADAIIVHGEDCTTRLNELSLVFEDDEKSVIDAKMCIYTINKSSSFDPAFIKYSSGFGYVVNSANKDHSVAIIQDGNSAEFTITDKSLHESLQGRGALTGTIQSTKPKAPINGTWELIQDKVVIIRGEIRQGSAEINATIDVSKPLTLKISAGTYESNSLILKDAIATLVR